MFGLRGNLFRSEDFGANWAPITTDSNITLAGGSTAASGEIALVGAVGTVLRSNDGGKSFSRSTLPDRLSLSSALYSDGRLILIGQGGARVYGGNDTDE